MPFYKFEVINSTTDESEIKIAWYKDELDSEKLQAEWEYRARFTSFQNSTGTAWRVDKLLVGDTEVLLKKYYQDIIYASDMVKIIEDYPKEEEDEIE